MEFEEDDGIDRGATACRIAVGDEIADKGEIERTVEMAVEMISGDERFEGNVCERGEGPQFGTHHRGIAPTLNDGRSRYYDLTIRFSTL